ncbi:class I SAM-dependent methyltransferase [Halomonas sp. McH1-25]|uniref:O-methyltransferase n=1 Tax=unclassified Halomonas TaxID=2609666 RepID=UPI001EF410CE|nr:class I SAM-dependent methyltransferase [Halomonas sp. McH1-25]MCP1343112.1 class I SAM-dependent methyltransferase [Halomonas sp. FL8]MCP1360479.1 class I SAM-dependent methyltransferase [Halomonas sp. BBD45]MCP1364764.1 class I SAM-dependent methyltransferase [Halomonas sp. BBD48]
MDALDALKAELEQFGNDNDSTHSERSKRMLNITRDTGEFLSVLVRATSARHILEIGTSNGYSTLWLAEAACTTGGHVTTVEASKYKANLASETFFRSGLSEIITLVHDDAGAALSRAADTSIDLLFLDSERAEYPVWWNQIRRVLRPGGLLIVDNAISHREEMAPFAALIESDKGYTLSLVPVGKGELLAVKAEDKP